jgi:hypothetical protein
VQFAALIVGSLMTQLPQQGRGTTEPRQSDPDVPLLDHIIKHFNELELSRQRQCEQRVEALDRLTEARFVMLRTVMDSHAERAALALAAADKAISKGDIATEKRFESVNEFRQTLSDQTKTFISRVEFEALRDTHAARIADLSSRLDKTEGKTVGLNAGWVYLIGALSAAGTMVSIVVAIFLRAG